MDDPYPKGRKTLTKRTSKGKHYLLFEKLLVLKRFHVLNTILNILVFLRGGREETLYFTLGSLVVQGDT